MSLKGICNTFVAPSDHVTVCIRRYHNSSFLPGELHFRGENSPAGGQSSQKYPSSSCGLWVKTFTPPKKLLRLRKRQDEMCTNVIADVPFALRYRVMATHRFSWFLVKNKNGAVFPGPHALRDHASVICLFFFLPHSTRRECERIMDFMWHRSGPLLLTNQYIKTATFDKYFVLYCHVHVHLDDLHSSWAKEELFLKTFCDIIFTIPVLYRGSMKHF